MRSHSPIRLSFRLTRHSHLLPPRSFPHSPRHFLPRCWMRLRSRLSSLTAILLRMLPKFHLPRWSPAMLTLPLMSLHFQNSHWSLPKLIPHLSSQNSHCLRPPHWPYLTMILPLIPPGTRWFQQIHSLQAPPSQNSHSAQAFLSQNSRFPSGFPSPGSRSPSKSPSQTVSPPALRPPLRHREAHPAARSPLHTQARHPGTHLLLQWRSLLPQYS